jgi:Ca-activated chloride channel family protein
MISHARLLFLLAMIAFLGAPVRAQEATDANLITAIDVSGSINAADERLEFEGMAAAVVDPRFLQAIARGRHGRIGFVAFTWANGEFVSLVPWTLISSQADAEQVAEHLGTARGKPIMGYATSAPGNRSMRTPANRRPWRTGHATDVSAAIERAIEVGADAPFASHHHVINMCANGIDNIGDGPAAARDQADAAGMIVNGLILGHREDAREIAAYFREHVQAGPGSFVIEARDFEDIASAMLAKFLFELAAVPPAPPGASEAPT